MALLRFPTKTFDRIPWMTLSIAVLCLVFSVFYLINQSRLQQTLTFFCVNDVSKTAQYATAAGTNRLVHRQIESCINLLRRIHSAPDKSAEIDEILASQPARVDRQPFDRAVWKKRLIANYERFSLLSPPLDLTNVLSYQAGGKNPLRMLSASLIHVDYPHLLMNIFFFLVFSSVVELVLGRTNVLLLSLLFSVGSHAIFSFYHLHAAAPVYTVGLSGVAMGMMVLSIVLAASIQLTRLSWRYVLLLSVFLVLFIAGDYLQSISASTEQPINYIAHASGALLGLFAGLYYYRRYFSAKAVYVLVLLGQKVGELLGSQQSGASGKLSSRINRCALRWQASTLPLDQRIRTQFHLYRKQNNKLRRIPVDVTPYGSIIHFGQTEWHQYESVLLVSPVYLESGIDQLHVLPQSKINLQEDEAKALIHEFNQHFADEGLQLHFDSTYQWLLTVSKSAAIGTDFSAQSLREVEGRMIDTSFLQGPDKTAWLRVHNETQMLLHQSLVNQARAERDQYPVNSLWIWGTGELPQAIRSGWNQVYADDLLTRSLAKVSQANTAPVLQFPSELKSGHCQGQVLIVITDDILHGIDPGSESDNASDKFIVQQVSESLQQQLLQPIEQALLAKQLSYCRIDLGTGVSLNLDKRILRRLRCKLAN